VLPPLGGGSCYLNILIIKTYTIQALMQKFYQRGGSRSNAYSKGVICQNVADFTSFCVIEMGTFYKFQILIKTKEMYHFDIFENTF
jgi:hypothetical protein